MLWELSTKSLRSGRGHSNSSGSFSIPSRRSWTPDKAWPSCSFYLRIWLFCADDRCAWCSRTNARKAVSSKPARMTASEHEVQCSVACERRIRLCTLSNKTLPAVLLWTSPESMRSYFALASAFPLSLRAVQSRWELEFCPFLESFDGDSSAYCWCCFCLSR